jgi:hypothetical protein
MIRLYGADNPDALRGPYLDGVVLDEFADMKPEVWHEVVRPMLADRRGSATFIGTPKGKNEFFRLYENAKKDPAWFHMMLKASDSGIIAPDADRRPVGCGDSESFRRLSAYATTLAPPKGRLTRCTVLGSTPNRAAILRMPSVRPGALRAARIRLSSSSGIRGRPSCLPSLLALLSPARTRS